MSFGLAEQSTQVVHLGLRISVGQGTTPTPALQRDAFSGWRLPSDTDRRSWGPVQPPPSSAHPPEGTRAWFRPLPLDLVRSEAWQTLRVGCPIVAVAMVIEALSHVDVASKHPDFVVLPLLGALVVAALAVWVHLSASEHVDPATLLLVPWGVVMASLVQNVIGGVATGATLFLGATLIAVATLFTMPGPLLVAGTVTAAVLAWASFEAFERVPWVYPALVVPMAGLVSLSRRRALIDGARRRSAEQAAALERARAESLRRTSTLAGGMAHHFNNLLAVIVGNCELLRSDPELAGREELVDVLEAARRASSLVEAVLALTSERLGDGAERVAIPDLCERACRDLPAERVQIAIDEGAPPVLGRATELVKALGEVLTNAVEASGDGEPVVLRADRSDDAVSITVEDRGEGIPDEALPHVTDPFFTRKGPDRPGLGLSYARAVVLAHRGELHVEPREGGGTSVRLLLPVARRGANNGD